MQKNIIITGTSRGIGLALVKYFSDNGHQVLALSRSPEKLNDLKLPNTKGLAFDITKEDTHNPVLQYVQDNWKQVDVLIHNSGAIVNKPFTEISTEEFRYVYEVNVIGVASFTKALLPVLPKDSHVVCISSMGGIQGSVKFPGLSAYSSSKAAVLSLVELLAEEYKENGPSFNGLALGAVQTEMLEEAFPGYKAPLSPKEMAAYIADFSLTGATYYNGKILQVSSTTP
ncbi:MAG TPA: SDR family oxidoreductase [Flavobacteriaceae bacterium]|nr:SDR family oxidoreductase [Flavobacteriaceae bacterium]